MKTEDALRKKIERLKISQKEAEQLLEKKSAELFALNKNLENLVEERTKEAEFERDRAIKANDAKSQFLANMSHEIRTPLNGMLGFLELVLASEATPTQKERLEIVKKSGDLLLILINDILEFSKIEAGKLEIDSSKFHLKRCVEDIVDVMANSAYEKGLDVPVFLDENIPKNLIGDPSRLRQVLFNIIGNAIKFTPSGEVSVNATSKGLNNHKEFVIKFSITDTGVGISEDKIKQIFSPFTQADISDTRKYGGTGLGLTICKEITNAMGGEILISSKEGEGSCFSFELPFKVPENESLIFSNRDLKELAVDIVGFSKTMSKNLERRLTSWNCQIKTFSSGGDKNIDNTQQRSLIINGDSMTPDDQEKILDQSQNQESSILVVCKPGTIHEIAERFTSNKNIYILSKPLKRESLFDSLSQKEKIELSKPQVSKSSDIVDSISEQATAQILLVEDNAINQKVAVAILSQQGYSVDVANNGEEALTMEADKNYSLILMDCQMPVMDGIEATRIIRQRNKEIKIVAMTANAFKKVKEECFEVGMNDFITKPIRIDKLQEVLSKYAA